MKKNKDYIYNFTPTAPPNTTIYMLSMHNEQWAALFLGPMPLGFNLVHLNLTKSNKYVSPVMVYFPVSPMAPPNNTAWVLDIKVMVCPNRG